MSRGGGGVPVGKGYVTIYPKIDAKGFHNDLNATISRSAKSAGSSLQNAMGKAVGSAPLKPIENAMNGFSLKSIGLGTVIGNVITASLGTIQGLTSEAVNRLDTLKQFPKVMSALGYSTEEADKSIKSIQKHLMGLPSTTSDITKFVKGIASAGLPLEKATRLGLGFNDMLLSAGASTYDASRAFVQFNQMLSAGKVDMQSWKTLTELMPAQLGKISETLLGAGKNQHDLYNALQKGEVTWEEFTDAIIKGAEEGGEGFEAFAKTAQEGMGGVGTAMQNLKSRFINGMVDVIDSIGQDNIKNALNGISTTFSTLADNAVPLIKPVVSLFIELAKVLSVIIPYLPPLVAGFLAFSGVIKAVEGWSKAVKVFSDISAGVQLVFESKKKLQAFFTLLSANPFVIIIASVAAVVAALVYFFTQTEQGREMWANFTQSLSDLWNTCVTGFMSVAQPVIDALIVAWDFLKSTLETIFNVIMVAWKVLCEVFNVAWLLFSTPFLAAWEVIKATVTLIVQGLQVLWEGFCALLAPLFDAGMVVINAVITALQVTFETVIGVIRTVWEGLCSFFAPVFEVGASIVTSTLSVLENIFTTVTDVIRTVWEGLCSFFAPVFEVASTVVTAAIEVIGNIFNTVSNTIKSIWNGVGSVLKSIGSSIGGFFKSIIPSTVGGAFSSARDRAVEKFNNMKTKMKGIIDSIVGFFTGANFSFPHIKLPHFSITGNFDLANWEVPHLSVDWYAKGGIFSSPSVIGVGEAGKEAVLPIDHIKPYFNEAVEDLPQGSNNDFEMLIYWLEQNLGKIIRAYAPTATPREFRRMVKGVE